MRSHGEVLAEPVASGWGPEARTVGRWFLGGALVPLAFLALWFVPVAMFGGADGALPAFGMLMLVGLMVGIPAAFVGGLLGFVAIAVGRRLPSSDDPRRRRVLALTLVAWWLACSVVAALLLRLTASDGLGAPVEAVAGAVPALVPTVGAYLTWRRRA